MFNNSPGGSSQKVHLNKSLFGLRTSTEGEAARAWTLRTHPPDGLPPITQIEYSGAFPVSRLRFSDPDLPIAVDLYAYSEFRIFDPQGSGTPAVIFTFNLYNPSAKPVETPSCSTCPITSKARIHQGRG
ncbi:MAG: GH116 family glycosyl-hydrolase [Candidatus Hadarchaeaceae archaeon]